MVGWLKLVRLSKSQAQIASDKGQQGPSEPAAKYFKILSLAGSASALKIVLKSVFGGLDCMINKIAYIDNHQCIVPTHQGAVKSGLYVLLGAL